jgi:small nuclear ribonucleoprotein (snRNP)-like protein
MLRGLTSFLLPALLTGAAHAQVEPERVKAWLVSMPAGQTLRITLTTGETLNGTLTETEDQRFRIRLPADPDAEETHRKSIMRWVEYREVAGLSGEGIHVVDSGRALAPLVEIGDQVKVRTFSGRVVEGKVGDFDGESLLINDERLDLAGGDVVRIDVRENDSLLNGTLIGLGIGAGWAALAWAACNDPDCGEVAPAASVFIIGVCTGVGALSDALRRGSTTIYTGALSKERITIAPLLTRDAKGVLISLRF